MSKGTSQNSRIENILFIATLILIFACIALAIRDKARSAKHQADMPYNGAIINPGTNKDSKGKSQDGSASQPVITPQPKPKSPSPADTTWHIQDSNSLPEGCKKIIEDSRRDKKPWELINPDYKPILPK